MWRRYQNELMIVVALLLLLVAIGFKVSQSSKFHIQSTAAGKLVSKIEDIDTMKKLWRENKAIASKIKAIGSGLSSQKIKEIKVDKRKAHVVLDNLNGNELNDITGKKLASIAIQIEELSIDRSGESYRLELRCKW